MLNSDSRTGFGNGLLDDELVLKVIESLKERVNSTSSFKSKIQSSEGIAIAFAMESLLNNVSSFRHIFRQGHTLPGSHCLR